MNNEEEGTDGLLTGRASLLTNHVAVGGLVAASLPVRETAQTSLTPMLCMKAARRGR